MNKKLKTSKVTAKTKILCFDLETNGLHGQAFAVGAVVMDADGKVFTEFTARCPVRGQIDTWVEQNVLPAISELEITHKSYKAMREAFWEWYLEAEAKSDYVLVSNGYPVEYRFLLDCQEADLEGRYWQHPFPIIDLSSVLLAVGQLLDTSKSKLVSKLVKEHDFKTHHPLHDAKLTVLVAFAALSAKTT